MLTWKKVHNTGLNAFIKSSRAKHKKYHHPGLSYFPMHRRDPRRDCGVPWLAAQGLPAVPGEGGAKAAHQACTWSNWAEGRRVWFPLYLQLGAILTHVFNKVHMQYFKFAREWRWFFPSWWWFSLAALFGLFLIFVLRPIDSHSANKILQQRTTLIRSYLKLKFISFLSITAH